MKTNSLFWALSWVAVGSFAIMQGCGGDDDDDGDDASGGKGGSSGSATGGSSGSSGRGGSSGSSGRGGSSGNGGTATGGAAGAPGGAGGVGGEESVGGEGGGGPQTRGELCVEYCTAYFTNLCNTSVNPANTYTDQPTCEVVCLNSAWPIGAEGEAGDTIWCRIDHANNAADTSAREAHCGHASQTPTAICVD